MRLFIRALKEDGKKVGALRRKLRDAHADILDGAAIVVPNNDPSPNADALDFLPARLAIANQLEWTLSSAGRKL